QNMRVLLSVRPNFLDGKKNDITQNEWTDLWQRALQVDYRHIVNIRAIKPNKKQDSAITSAIKETAKYIVKSSDYLTDDLESNLKAVEDLERGLYAKRLISYGGALKTAHKRLNLDDNEDGDLIHTSDDEISETESKANSIIAIF